jgi:HAD superfamily, subfamily IIIB (Acid phosphatase)
MSLETQRPKHAAQPARALLQRTFRYAAIVGLLSFAASTSPQAQSCAPERKPNLPALEEPKDNIDRHKKQLRAYEKGAYKDDIKLVLDDALAYVMSRADKVERPAVVLDIDETSLSNWDNIAADDFGYIGAGECSMVPKYPCGFPAWINRAEAKAIEPTRTFFNAVRARNIAVFFITGRRDSQRKVTILNLHREGFDGWSGLMTRPDDDKRPSIVPFKSGERAKVEAGDEPYHIIATIGDQQSDLDGGHAECRFKIPNPFYFIE